MNATHHGWWTYYTRQWKCHLAIYIVCVVAALGSLEYLFSELPPLGAVRDRQGPVTLRIFDCFLYNGESYMLYLHLATLAPVVDKFVVGYANITFTNQSAPPLTLSPFDEEIARFSSQVLYLFIDLAKLKLAQSKWGNETAWRREATARNFLIEGINLFNPEPNDLILLCDVDEITTRHAVHLIRRHPPTHYYNLKGILYHYNFRWRVSETERPLVIRYGSLRAPLDDYKFMPFISEVPGVLHHHCSSCFAKMSDLLKKLSSLTATENSEGNFTDPNQVYARIACGYGVMPSQSKVPERLTLINFNKQEVWVPNDVRFDYLRHRIGFRDLADLPLNTSGVEHFRPEGCNFSVGSVVGVLV
jgi:hypothetical protein